MEEIGPQVYWANSLRFKLRSKPEAMKVLALMQGRYISTSSSKKPRPFHTCEVATEEMSYIIY